MNIPESAIAGFVDFYTMFKTKPRAKYVIGSANRARAT